MATQKDTKVVLVSVRPQPARIVVQEKDLVGLATSPRVFPVVATEKEGKKYRLPAGQAALESACLLALRAYRNLFLLTFTSTLADYRQHIQSNPWIKPLLADMIFSVTIAKANGPASTVPFSTVLTILDSAITDDAPVSENSELEIGEEI